MYSFLFGKEFEFEWVVPTLAVYACLHGPWDHFSSLLWAIHEHTLEACDRVACFCLLPLPLLLYTSTLGTWTIVGFCLLALSQFFLASILHTIIWRFSFLLDDRGVCMRGQVVTFSSCDRWVSLRDQVVACLCPIRPWGLFERPNGRLVPPFSFLRSQGPSPSLWVAISCLVPSMRLL